MKTLAAAAVLCIAPAVASAAVVNLDSELNTKVVGQGVTLMLDAGSYSVTPFDNSAENDGFIAWNAWKNNEVSGCDQDGANCARGWLTSYAFRIGSDAPVGVGRGRFDTPEKALLNATPTTFTLASDGTVEFFISDSNYSDNDGGVSLNVAPVPVPAAIGLLVGAFAALGLVRRRA